jgi:hypothetical protein
MNFPSADILYRQLSAYIGSKASNGLIVKRFIIARDIFHAKEINRFLDLTNLKYKPANFIYETDELNLFTFYATKNGIVYKPVSEFLSSNQIPIHSTYPTSIPRQPNT